jgi:hypothetical protein
VGIVAVRVTGGDHEHAEPDDFDWAMHDFVRCTRVIETSRQAIGKSQPALNLAQRQQAPF